MEHALMLFGLVIFGAGCMVAGAMLNESKYKKCSSFLVKYRRLSPKSKEMVNNYLVAREVYDVRKYDKKV